MIWNFVKVARKCVSSDPAGLSSAEESDLEFGFWALNSIETIGDQLRSGVAFCEADSIKTEDLLERLLGRRQV